MHLLLFIANKFDFQLIAAVIFHNLWAAVTGEHQSCCTLMCLMMLSVACFRRRWNSPPVTQMHKQNQKNDVFQYFIEDGLKTIPALHKSQNWKRRARSLGRYCFLVFIAWVKFICYLVPRRVRGRSLRLLCNQVKCINLPQACIVLPEQGPRIWRRCTPPMTLPVHSVGKL